MSLLSAPFAGGGPATEDGDDLPRLLKVDHRGKDRIFRDSFFGVATLVLVLFLAIGAFLLSQSFPTFKRYGLGFITHSTVDIGLDKFGILGVIEGTFEVAIIALVIAFPLALACALCINEYAPPRLRSVLVAMVDLMATVPSVIIGLWGFLALQPQLKYVARWLAQNLAWIPFFKVPGGDANGAVWVQSRFTQSAFIAGICVSLMVIPIACSVMLGVFAQTPLGEREAAYALGGTKAGVIRSVVLPFGRGGIIGGTMLGLGRALGETMSVLLIININYNTNIDVLQTGTATISSFIADNYGDATQSHYELSALLTAGFLLFVITLIINTIAAVIVGRGRSGASTL